VRKWLKGKEITDLMVLSSGMIGVSGSGHG
jgi:hypothetical protein